MDDIQKTLTPGVIEKIKMLIKLHEQGVGDDDEFTILMARCVVALEEHKELLRQDTSRQFASYMQACRERDEAIEKIKTLQNKLDAILQITQS